MSSIERAVSHPLIAPDQAREASKRVAAGEPLREIALSYNVDHSTICRLKARYAAEIQGRGVVFWGAEVPIARPGRAQGHSRDRRDCMKQFKTGWERFADDEANLVEYLNAKRKRR